MSMRIGMSLPQAGGAGSREAIARVARGAEEIGLDSLWVLDRLLRPRHPVSAGGGAPARVLPEFYASVFDPLETLTFAAALTERVELGTSVILALLHPPVVLAKRLATLDQLSGGRVIAGIGQGWMADEFAVAGVAMSRRGALFAEHTAAMRAVWGTDPVAFSGRVYTIPPSDIGPKPARPGGIPVLVGSHSEAATWRAGTFADGLNPLASTLHRLHAAIATFHDGAREAGRDPTSLQVVLRANAELSDARRPEEGRRLFAGTREQWVDDLARVRELGIEHVHISLDGPPDEQLRVMAALRDDVARRVG